MRIHALLGAALCLAVVPFGAAAQSFDRLPPGWHRVGMPQVAADYFIQLDGKTKHGGERSLRIQSTRLDARGFAGVTQAIKAEPYRGTRVRLRGYARFSDVAQWAGLWMRIDGPTLGAFDNMQGRPFMGTADWSAADVVLDVPSDATAIYVGALLAGSGTLWIDDFAFDSVSQSVAATGRTAPVDRDVSAAAKLPLAFTNLGFEPGR